MDSELYEQLIAQKEYVIKTIDNEVITGDINACIPVEKIIGIVNYSSMDILNIIFLAQNCSIEYVKSAFLKNIVSQINADKKTFARYRMTGSEYSLDDSKLINELKTFEALRLIEMKNGIIELNTNIKEDVAKYRLKMQL